MFIERDIEQERVRSLAQFRYGYDEKSAQKPDDDGDRNQTGLAVADKIAQA
ncbi:hypothetical protein [Bradyrhizobium sp. Leo170]|uniref:hypothetical protein n=1 Tax=Bradyrhizobium sp. Leo170 TaxID=1571199 RepID=UPI001FE23EDC|nr:hypothetical protein [Bradyrhizobium sp. Leo170]